MILSNNIKKHLLGVMLFLLAFLNSHAQNNSFSYTQFDFSIPLKANTYSDSEPYSSPSQNKYWFLADGINFDAGYGIHYKEFVGLGAHFGIHLKASDKLAYSPFYLNLRIAPKIGSESRLVLQTGLGKALTYGRGNNHGSYFRLSLGYQSDDSTTIYLLINSIKGLRPEHLSGFGSISIGISITNLLYKQP